jgi:hypothetical protein
MRLIHVKGAPLHEAAVQSSNCFFNFRIIGHFNEGKAAWLSRTIVTLSTCPYTSNFVRSSASVQRKSKFPTKMFFMVGAVIGLFKCQCFSGE